MHYYNIADLNVIVEKPGVITLKNGEKYASDKFDIADISVPYDDRPFPDYADTEHYKDVVVHMRECNKFYKALLRFNGLLLHASAVVVDDKAYLFSAPSGTGKSTHTELWLKKFKNRAYILNDDKPAIRIINDSVYAYGTPWSGKNDISVNIGVPVQGICFLQRDTNNWIERIDSKTAAVRMFHATLRTLTQEQIALLLPLLDSIISKIPIYVMGCRPDLESVDVSYNMLSKS